MTFNVPTFRRSSNNSNLSKTNIERVFEDVFHDFSKNLFTPFLGEIRGEYSPKLDISERDNTYHIEVEMPGINKKNIEVKIDNNILYIKGNVTEESEDTKKNYYVKERYSGSFQRSISLPHDIQEHDIQANFKDGVLKIDINKKGESAAKKIEIKE